MTAPRLRALHWQYIAFCAFSVLGTVVAVLLIVRHGPGWGLIAALAGLLASGEGIRRTANRWNAALDPATLTTRSAARALYFARDHQSGQVWRRLTAATGPTQRAALYRDLAGLFEDIAVVFLLVHHDHANDVGQADPAEQVEALRDRNDEIRLLYAVADAEQARATGTLRARRPWLALEQHAGALLDRIADSSAQATPQDLADLYWQLADQVDATGVVDGTATDVLCSISRSYASRAWGAPVPATSLSTAPPTAPPTASSAAPSAPSAAPSDKQA